MATAASYVKVIVKQGLGTGQARDFEMCNCTEHARGATHTNKDVTGLSLIGRSGVCNIKLTAADGYHYRTNRRDAILETTVLRSHITYPFRYLC